MTASKAGDLAAVLDLMTDDVIFMTPGRAPFGKGEFAANGERMKDFTMEGHHDLQEIEILGKRACIRKLSRNYADESGRCASALRLQGSQTSFTPSFVIS